MKDPHQIQQEIAAYGKVSTWGCKKELKGLAHRLEADEHIIALVRVFTSSTIALLVATDRRLILMDAFWLFGTDPKVFSYGLIAAVDYNTGIFFGGLAIEDNSHHRDQYSWVLINDLRKFVQVVSMKISQVHGDHAWQQNLPPKQPESKSSPVSAEIEKLWSLVEKGALTKQEFETKKKQLLAQT